MLGGAIRHFKGLPWWLSGKETTYQVEDTGSIPGSGRSTGEGNGNPPFSSTLAWRTPRTEEAWRAAVHRVTKSWTQVLS